MFQLTGKKDVAWAPEFSQSQIWDTWQQVLEHAEPILNLEMYGPVQSNTVVIVVQVRTVRYYAFN